MPAKPNATPVGRLECSGCGDSIPVFQAVNSYLYTKCPQCGVDQRYGARIQAQRWFGMVPIDGAQVTRPVNVPETAPDWISPKVVEPKVEEEQQTVDAEEAAAADGEADQGGGGLFWLLVAGFGIGVGAVVKGLSS
jgi:predicted  nucleic acid-binding Zn-ribbon protein